MFSGGSGNAPEVEYAAVIQRGRNDLETSEVLLPAMVTMNNNGSETNDFAIIFQNLCNYYYKEHKDSIRIQEEWNATETASRWKKERDTWSLIEQLYGERLSSLMEEEEDVSQRMVLEEGGIKGETDFTRVQSLLKKDQSLREYLIVRRWLEDNAPEFRQVETRKGYWLYTRKRLKESNMSSGAMGSQQHGKGTTTTSSPALLFGGMPAVPGGGGGGGGGGSNRGETTIISAMDPDAPSRQKRSIVPDDAEWEQSFLRTLYEYVRRGKMDDAVNLCRECDQPWRAASLRGSLYFFDPELEEPSEIPIEVEDKGGKECRGNINRRLWKETCAALASDERVGRYERALYAALCGRLDEILGVCETWEDNLWAYFVTMLETLIDKGVEEKDAQRVYIPSNSNGSIRCSLSKYQALLEPAKIVEALQSHESRSVRTESRDPYRRLQSAVILNQFDRYLEGYARSLRADSDDEDLEGTHHGASPSLSSLSDTSAQHVVRLVVHVILYLLELGFELPVNSCSEVIERYIQILIANGHRELVALYTIKLPPAMQSRVYAEFLAGINDKYVVRAGFLRQAEGLGIDVEATVKEVVDLVLLKYSPLDTSHLTAPSDAGGTRFDVTVPEITLASVPVSVQEEEQIRSIEWLMYSQDFYGYALEKVTDLARRFLLKGRLNAATKLFNSLPPDFVQPTWLPSQDHDAGQPPSTRTSKVFEEYIKMVSLCDAYTTYESWARVQGQEALLTAARQPAQPSVERAWLDWKKEVENLTQRTAQLFRENILESGWLDESVMLAETDLDSECRNAQITALRAIYIPDVIFLLYEVLYKTRDVVEGNLRESLELSQLVASDDGAIYKEMAKRSPKYPEGQLLRFLDLMRQSARQLMLTDQLRQQRQRIYSTDISSVRVKSS